MTREQILSVVTKHLVDALDDLDPAAIDTSQSMKDLGANSLDIVEVVSRTMRELKIKVPRSELAKLTNIDALVDLLYQVAREQARAA
jgi:acyl carrier protein